MVDPVTLTMVRDIVTILGVIIAFTYYVLVVRASQRNQKQQLETRQAQLFMQIYDKFTDKEFVKDWSNFVLLQEWKDYNEYIEKFGPNSNLDAWSSRVSLSNYFEGIGVLIKRKLIDPNLVDDLMSTGILSFWRKWGPLVEEYRKDFNAPQMSEYQEYLYNQIRSIAEKQHPDYEGKIMT